MKCVARLNGETNIVTLNNGGVECGISIKIDGEWITKWDAAENTQVEAVKGGRSGAMKRAAVQWGIGRYQLCNRTSASGKHC